MDTASDLSSLPLKELEELAYALQIDYDPPLREEDRQDVIREIIWVSDHRDEILANEEQIKSDRKRRRKRDGIMCHQEESFITGDNLLLLSDQQLIFLPFVSEGRKRYYCFTRYEANYLLKNKKNPYTGEIFSQVDLDYIRNELNSKEYPNIHVNNILVEIEERLAGKKLEYSKLKYRELADRLVKIVEDQVGDFIKPGSLYDFASDLSTKDYNTFLKHDELRQNINADEDRNDAAAETLNHILNRYNLLKGTNLAEANKFIINVALAMEEFLYMIKNKLSYDQLLEEKGEEVNGVKELHWKPYFLRDGYHADGPHIDYYENGQIERRINYLNDMKNGLEEKFYENGQIERRTNYVNDERDGLEEIFYENGQFERRTNYVNDKRDGLEERFSEDGQIEHRINYLDDKRHGLSEYFYENGQIEMRTNYVNDKRDGLDEYFNEDGQILIRTNYVNDKKHGLEESFYEGGRIRQRTNYVNDKRDGLEESFYKNGQIKMRTNYVNNRKHGLEEYFHENGQIRQRINYIGGRRV